MWNRGSGQRGGGGGGHRGGFGGGGFSQRGGGQEAKICPFFLTNSCKFGNACRNRHVLPDSTHPSDAQRQPQHHQQQQQQQPGRRPVDTRRFGQQQQQQQQEPPPYTATTIREDMALQLVWPFTSYGPDKTAYPPVSLVGPEFEYSPEEIRWEFYKARVDPQAMHAYMSNLQQMMGALVQKKQGIAQNAEQAVVWMNEQVAARTAKNVFVQSSATAGNAFGQVQPSSVFAQPQPQPSSAFSQLQPQPQPSSAFTQPQPQPQPSSAFSQPQAQPSSAFAQPQLQQPQQSQMPAFGQQPQPSAFTMLPQQPPLSQPSNQTLFPQPAVPSSTQPPNMNNAFPNLQTAPSPQNVFGAQAFGIAQQQQPQQQQQPGMADPTWSAVDFSFGRIPEHEPPPHAR